LTLFVPLKDVPVISLFQESYNFMGVPKNVPGNINQQLIEAIRNCRYAICYLSRKNSAGDFRDNRNVIFEAGMFHGRTEETSAVPSRWIPVREKDSHRPPFDFAQERILLVERNKDGSLKQKVFANKFRERVVAMLNPP
jgi:hypothetical protein